MLTLKTIISNKKVRIIFYVVAILFFSHLLKAQTTPFSQRKTWDGPYDVKMIAAPNLQAVFLNSSQAATGILHADSIIRNDVIRRTGDLLAINNLYMGGSPFVKFDVPKSAFMCGNPEVAGCTAGQLATTGTCSSGITYTGPDYATNMYVSMTYSDYDGDMSTFSSSMAQLDISSCAEIEAAYLYWTGDWKGSNANITLDPTGTGTYNGYSLNSYNGSPIANNAVFNTSTTSGYNSIKFKRPGGTYQNVTSISNYIGTQAYVCVADVTSMIQGTGGGQFWAANIQSYPNEKNGGSTSGWTLVVIFRSPLSPPRLIYLWDGFVNITKNNSTTLNLTGLTTPSTTNFKSYVGFAALDGENLAPQLSSANVREGLGFQTNAGGTYVEVNPFAVDQPPYKLYNRNGYPAMCNRVDDIDGCKKPLYDGNWCSTYDGISSSHITSYNEVTDKNGNEIVRLPSNVNTLGLDAHHMKLPNGAVTPGATTATLTVKAGPQGSTLPYMAYMAIERLQPKLTMNKMVNLSSTGLGSQLIYTIRVKNQGNTASLGGDIVYDSLDVATNYTPGSFAATKYVNGIGSSAGIGVTFARNLDSLQFTLVNPIGINDSVDIKFTVDITSDGGAAIFSPPNCKRTIENTAWIIYNVMNAPYILTAKSNSDDCNIGAQTRTLIIDPALGTPLIVPMGTTAACSMVSTNIVSTIQQKLIAATATTGATAANILDYDIRDAADVRVQGTDVFGTLNGNVTYRVYHNNSSIGACQERFDFVFNCPPPCPVGIISGTNSVCNNGSSTATISVALTGTAPFTFVYAIDGVNQAPITTSLTTYYFASALAAANHTYTLVSLDDALFNGANSCGVLSGSAVITPKPMPSITSAVTNTTYCSGTGQNYAITSSVGSTTYSWSRAAVAGISNTAVVGQTANPITETLTNSTAGALVVRYVITPTAAGCTGTSFNYDVTVNPTPVVTSAATGSICSGTAQNYDITSNIGTATFSWSRAVVTGISNPIATAQAADPMIEALTNTTTSSKTVTYIITPSAGGCAGTNFNYAVTVNPTPVVTSAATGSVCSGIGQNYNITSGVGTATFSWDRAAVAGISNPALASQATDPIAEALTNTTTGALVVRYVITPTAATCVGAPYNYDVTVNPTPSVTSVANNLPAGICSGTAQNYDITSNVGTATFSWSHAAVAGISNAAVAGQTSDPITETLNNTGATTPVVRYVITPTAAGCTGTTFNYDVTVNPTPTITSALTGSICSGTAQNYDITSNISTATFSWSRAAVAGISNPALATQTTDPITEALTNTTTGALVVRYVITPTGAGFCPGIATNYDVTVNPITIVNSALTGTICSGVPHTYDITSNVTGTTFSWSRAAVAGISNAAVTAQTSDPIAETLTNATTGALAVRYVITPTFAGCPGTPLNYDLTVNPSTVITTQPVDANLCAGVPLNLGVVSTGLVPTYQWMKNGSPIGGAIGAIYTVAISSLADAGNYTVVLTNACPLTSNPAVVTITTPPVNTLAVSDDQLCEGANGIIIISGSEPGKRYEAFDLGSGTSVSTISAGNGGNLTLSIPASHLTAGSHTIEISAYGCDTTTLLDQSTIDVMAIPVANAGQDIQVDDYIPIHLDGSASSTGAGYTYLWTSSDPTSSTITSPTAITTAADVQTINLSFTLTVTDVLNTTCTATDVVNVKVQPKPVVIPNVFSPNGDGVHDTFVIQNMTFFKGAVLYIYNQWGELIYKSEPGYSIPWDGKRNGKDVPVSAYYYILELNLTGFSSLSGDITIIK